MIAVDSFVVLTPLLLLPVVLMLVFVGCVADTTANGDAATGNTVHFAHDLPMIMVQKIEVKIEIHTTSPVYPSGTPPPFKLEGVTGAASYSISVDKPDAAAGFVRCTCQVWTSAGQQVVSPSRLDKYFVEFELPGFTLRGVTTLFKPEDVPTPDLQFTLSSP